MAMEYAPCDGPQGQVPGAAAYWLKASETTVKKISERANVLWIANEGYCGSFRKFLRVRSESAKKRFDEEGISFYMHCKSNGKDEEFLVFRFLADKVVELQLSTDEVAIERARQQGKLAISVVNPFTSNTECNIERGESNTIRHALQLAKDELRCAGRLSSPTKVKINNLRAKNTSLKTLFKKK